MPETSIVIINWNTRDMLSKSLDSIEQTREGLDLEIIVVDNNSHDGSQEMVAERYPQVRLVANRENVGFARANNQAARLSKGRFLLLLNSDACLLPGSLAAMLELARAEPRAGLVGAHLRNFDGSFQASHSRFPRLRREFLILSGLGRKLYGPYYPSHGPQEEKGPQVVDYVEGACMLTPRQLYLEAGGLDEGYFMYAEEVDLCYTLRRLGWQVWYHPAARVLHFGGGSSLNRRTQREGDLYRSRVRFFRKNYGDGAARWLKALILALTAIKIVAHGTLRLASGGRRGRRVISLRDLSAKLEGV